MEEKECNTCTHFKPLREFSPNGFDKNGIRLYKNQCKKCRSTIETKRNSKKEKLKDCLNGENFSYNTKALKWLYMKKGENIE